MFVFKDTATNANLSWILSQIHNVRAYSHPQGESTVIAMSFIFYFCLHLSGNMEGPFTWSLSHVSDLNPLLWVALMLSFFQRPKWQLISPQWWSFAVMDYHWSYHMTDVFSHWEMIYHPILVRINFSFSLYITYSFWTKLWTLAFHTFS